MKANFNIEKNIRNSHSISALSAFRKLQSLGLLLCTLLIGSLQVWGTDYVLVKNISNLSAGDHVLLVSSTDYNEALGTTQNNNNRSAVGVTISSETISSPGNTVQVLTLGKSGDYWTFYSPSPTTGYLYAAGSGGNYLKTEGSVSDNSKWAIEINTTTGLASIVASLSSNRNVMQYNNSSHIFACYSTASQKAIYIYKEAAAGYTVTIARNNSSYGTVSAASVTNVTSGTAISASSNVLTIGTGGGATNVTATPNSGYKFSSWSGIPGGGTVTGNITVTANFAAVSYSNYRTSCTPPSDPSITVSPASITNLDYIVGQGPSAAQNITLGGSNLTASITITAPTNFEVSLDGGSTYGDSKTVTQTGGVPDVSTVKVRLKAGLAVNTYGSANVTFESTGATTQNVAVTGHVLKPTITATPNPVSWSTAVGVAPSTTSVTVTGVNMKANISAALGGTNASDFSISPASITQTSGSASESITITYTGAYNAVATKTATLTLSSTDADDVVVNITFNVINDPNLYFLTNLEDINPKDKVIIVGSLYVSFGDEYEEDYALANATTTSTYPPDAVDVKAMISANKQTLSYSGTALQWNINYNSVSREFTINRDGDDDVFLYCKDDNKGLSVGTTGDYNVYNITSDYIKCKYLTRYLGVYNSDDWRTYGTNGGNIADQIFTFYAQPSTDPYVTLGANFSEFTYEYNHGPSTPQSFTVSGANLAANLVVTAPTNYEVCKTSGGTYTSSVSFTPSTGTVSEQTVYIRLAAGLSVGEYDYAQSSGLSVTSGEADPVKAALEGSVTPETFTVTATSNNGSYGSVSPASQNTSTTATITATPESGYRVISGAGGYTVTSGTATVVNNGNNTFTVTPTTDCTVQINFEAIVMRTVSWNVNGNPYSTYTGAGTLSTSAEEGAKWSTLTLPDNPADNTLYAGCERTKFVGWSASPLYGDGNSAPSDLFKTTADDNADSHTISGNTTFYAVFAKGSGDGWQKVTSTPADWCGDYLLVYEVSSSSVYVWNGTTDASNYVSATPDEGIITKPSGAVEITIEHFGVTSNYAIKAKEGANQGKYFKGDGGNGFTLENAQQNTSIGDVTDMGFTFSNSSSYLRFNTTAGQTRFRYYKQSTAVGASYKEICLYEPAAAFTDYLTQCCSLEPVTNLHVSASSANSVTLAWTLPADMTGITKFQVIDVDNANAVVKDNISTSATNSGSISGLTECDTYHYKVVSYGSTCTTTTSTIEVQPYGAAKTVTFNYNGGSGSPASFTTSCAGNTVTLPTPNARDGYTFLGWYPGEYSGSKTGDAGDTYTVTGTTTLWAHWAQNFTLTMATNPAAVSANITSPRSGAGTVANKYAGEVITVTVTKPAHYDFVRWQSSNGGSFANSTALSTTFTMPNNATTVTAVFEAEAPRVVTWSDNGSTTPENVQDGETTTFPALVGCDTYVAVGWVEDNSNTFTSETLTKPGTIYAAETTTPAITGDVTYKAVYRHKYYTNDAFVNGTTDGEGYYLYADVNGTKYYKTTYEWSSDRWATSTNRNNAVPVLLEKVGSSYYMRDVSTDKYYYGSSNLEQSDDKEATNAYKWTFSTPTCDPTKGNYKVVNENDKDTKTLLFTSQYSYIKEYANSNCCTSNYYDLNLEPGYYYKYSPTKACYVITVSTNSWSDGDFYTIDPSTKILDGTQLTVKVTCGKTISSWSFTSGTASLASGDEPEYLGMEDDKEVYRFTIIPETDATIRINFGNGATRTISFLDGATTLGQTKTTAITDKRDCQSYTLPAGYNTASGSGGACTGWTFDGWTATNYTYGQMGTPSDIVAAGTSQDVHGDKTWYAVYHKTFAAGEYFKLKYGDYYIADFYNVSDYFTTTTTEADGLMFQLEDDYLYYIDKTTRAKKWVYYGGTDQRIAVDDNKPTSNSYKTTIASDGNGKYTVRSNSRYLEINGSQHVVFYAATDASRHPTKPDASGFTAYYPKTDCAIEYVTVTYDAGAGNSCSPASASVESGATFTLPVESDVTYDNTDWTFVGWSESVVTGVVPGAPADLIAGGGSYSTFTNVTLHAVYSQVPPDGTFDNTKGGKYIIWGEDGGTNYYARSNGQTQGKLSNTLSCSEAAIFEFVETETAGQYKIHISGEAKYLAGQGCGHSDTDFKFENAEDAPVWTVTETAPSSGIWKVISTCNDRGFIFETSGSKQFGHYSSTNPVSSPSLYKFVHIGQCDDYYTTNPNKTLNITGNVMVTSTNGRMIMAKDQLTVNASNIGGGATITVTSNSSDVYFSLDRNANISKAAANQPKTSVNIVADGSGNKTQTVYVHYMPSVSTNGIENVTVSVSSPEKTAEATIKVRHLPATFAIAAKVGTAWYALTGNMHGAANPKAIQIDVDESTWTAYAPDTCAYQIWPVKTTNTVYDRYALQGGNAYGERVRFSAVNNSAQRANAGLWANNSSTKNTIDNDAAITAISSDPAEAYEWKIAATEVSGTWKYTLQTDQSNNTNKLNIHRDENLIWGTYSDGQAVTSDIYLLPISVITPFEFKVVEWYPTKVLIYTDNDMSETTPTIKINGETVASTTFNSKGGKLYEVGNLTTLTSHPSELMKVTYTKSAVTYTAVKTIPVILSRCTLNVTAAPFSTLTKEVYSKTDLVVRDNSILTLNGTQAENEFYDVTIYPTAKISVPSDKTFSVHSLTFFGGIDEIYNGSSYALNKYGVPQLSMKGIFKKKTVSTIDYVMRVDDRQMYSLALPYDVNLADIKYWNGTAMTLGTHLWVSAYDGEARATGVGRTWIYEEQFESKFGAAKLTAGVGYTISAEYLAALGSTYSIIRMPMTSNIAVDASEAAKSVAVKGWTAAGAHDNNKGWNLVGNPYMVSVSGSTAGGAENTKLAVGHLEETGTGPWKWVSEEYRYVTIPLDNGSDYYQKKWTDATLPPFKNFFLQVIEDGDLTFALASRNDAPARFLQTTEREIEFEILLSNDARQDNMGLLIADQYSPAYEINADLEKMIGSMSVYTIYGGYNLAYNALSPDDAKTWIPVGYVAPTAGQYTFAIDEDSDLTEVEHIYLTDYEQNVTIDLTERNYTFTTTSGKNEGRFAINATLKDEHETPTGIDVVNGGGDLNTDQVQKFIYRDKMYILRGGVIYDATGKRIKTINK